MDGILGQARKLKIHFEEAGILLVQMNFQIKGIKLVISPECMRFIVVARMINL